MLLAVAATKMEMKAFTRCLPEKLDIQTLVCGVGPVETALQTGRYLARAKSSLHAVLHFGIAGAYVQQTTEGPGLLDLCLATEEVLGDFGICFSDRIEALMGHGLEIHRRFVMDEVLRHTARKALTAEGFSVYQGRFVTVSCVSGTRERGDMLGKHFSALCENMEGAAVARVCQEYGIPCLELRCISNMVENRNTGSWKLKEACERAGRAAALLTGRIGFELHD